MLPKKKYTGKVSIVDGKIKEIYLTLPNEPTSEIQKILALKHIVENYIKEYEKQPERRF